MRCLLTLGFLVLPMTAAMAQQTFTPLSGPNTSIDSPICALVNFGFCPQPPSPPLAVPDPNEVAARPVATPVVAAVPGRHHHRRSHVHHATE